MNFKKSKRILIKNRESGITLIALVVTIIILLILTGVTVILAINENGIIGKAGEAAMKYELSSILEEVNLKVTSKQVDSIKKQELDGFESIEYTLPSKYSGKLMLVDGKLYSNYFADNKLKQVCKELGITSYYVIDETLSCLCTGETGPVQDGENWIWEDISGNNRHYTIHNYNENCKANNGINLSIAEKTYLKRDREYEKSKTAIITISNIKDDNLYALFRGDANNYTSYFKLTNDELCIKFQGQEEVVGGYPKFEVSVPNRYGDVIQIASTLSNDGIQKIYVNGELVATKSERKVSNYIQNIGGRYNPYDYYYNYEANYTVHSVQLYDRELDEFEILNNYEYDKKVYGI